MKRNTQEYFWDFPILGVVPHAEKNRSKYKKGYITSGKGGGARGCDELLMGT